MLKLRDGARILPDQLAGLDPVAPGARLPEPNAGAAGEHRPQGRFFRWYGDRGIRAKLFIAFAALDVLLVVLVVLLFPVREWREMRSERQLLAARGQSLAALVGGTIAPAVEFGDAQTVQNTVRETAQLMGEVAQIAVFHDGKLLARHGSGQARMPAGVEQGDHRAVVESGGSLFVAHALPLSTGTGSLVVELSQAELRQRVMQSLLFALTLSLAFLAVGGILAVLLARGIVRSVQAVVETVTAVTANGSWDLTRRARVLSGDEPGRLAVWINGFLGESSVLVSSVSRVARGVVSGVSEMSASLEQLSASAEALSETIEVVAESTTGQVARMAENAQATRQTATLAEGVRERAAAAGASAGGVVDSARSGREVAEHARAQMSQISQRTAETRRAMDDLNALSGQIDEVLGAIQSIASQTNLLALNAAIEAARAGEHGRGFAVVAEEVRKLAEQAARHTSRIGESVQAIRGTVQTATHAVSKVEAEVTNGVDVITSTADLLRRVVEEVEGVAGDVSAIADLAVDQQTSLARVLEGATALLELSEQQAASATEMAATVQEQTASTSEAASSAEQLRRMAEELEAAISKIHV